MSVLNSLFDIVKGGHTGNDVTAIDETSEQHSSVAASDPLLQGDVVFLESDGKWARATSVDLNAVATVVALATAIASLQHLWLVVSGAPAEQYDGLKQGYVGTDFTYVPYKVTAIRGEIMYETDQFVTGRAYVPGDALSVDAGKLDRLADHGATRRQYAETFSYDSVAEKLTATLT